MAAAFLPAAVVLAAPRRLPPGPRLVLESAGGTSREVEVHDLKFVYDRRTYYTRHAPRSEATFGRRTDVEDRRKECRCLRLQDWSKIKFKVLRQIEIDYPVGDPSARLRITSRTGDLREIAAKDLFGGEETAPARLAATVDGVLREFPLALSGPADAWPEERVVRVLFVVSPPPPPKRPSRHH
jgi:hypothetical protein